ncbi:hypothetical protein JCGZ_24610 [Jatropha curcas]|uniref:Fungal lipase-type domain-containing protein n=1 Tax=Jatropha curcas TaxID=180498 RepID=A0A067KWM1_JATCU|nr:hypothetical protein JCGZ_24610 [Jatropha curcas]
MAIDGPVIKYLIVNHGKRDVWSLLLAAKTHLWNFSLVALWIKDKKSGLSFLDSSDEEVKLKAAVDSFWVLVLSYIFQIFLLLIQTPMKYVGDAVDFVLNFISQNGGFSGILNNILRGKVVIPKRGAENFLSSIGFLDDRIDLYKNLADKADEILPADGNSDSKLENRKLMDLCIMASKLAYENAKMNFVGFYDCWNEYQKESNTQVFIFSDKPKDANLIVISFRGTEPFNAQDWITDVDFSWYGLENVGKIHVGFLEAMGLGDRSDITTFVKHLQKKDKSLLFLDADSEKAMLDLTKNGAFYVVAIKLCNLLKEHRNAKFVVTGHSLGGALAILFPTVLVIQEETELLQKMLNIYTFGQPRIGDKDLATYMETQLSKLTAKYFRVVYCNDMVPRLPFDDKFFHYKHYGECIYYDSNYFSQVMKEEPHPNFFGLQYFIPMRKTALWELLKSLAMGYIHGPDYKESWESTLFRVMGLVLPGVASHSPVNYVNSVRLGRERILKLPSFALM